MTLRKGTFSLSNEREVERIESEAAESDADQILSEEEAEGAPEGLQARYDELQDRHLRLMAEYDNFRKRTAREKDEIFGGAVASVLVKLLPVQDNFERARQYDCGSEEFAKGFEMIEKNFCDTLSALGVEPFGEVGEPFDPEKHHAVMHIEDESLGENVVAQVMQKGYKMGEKVLRHAMVQTAN